MKRPVEDENRKKRFGRRLRAAHCRTHPGPLRSPEVPSSVVLLAPPSPTVLLFLEAHTCRSSRRPPLGLLICLAPRRAGSAREFFPQEALRP